MGETIGADSSCFMSTLVPANDITATSSKGQLKPICYKVTCNSDYTYTVSIGTVNVICPSAGRSMNVPRFD